MTIVLKFGERDDELDRLVAAEIEAFQAAEGTDRDQTRAAFETLASEGASVASEPLYVAALAQAESDFVLLVANWLKRRRNKEQLLERICTAMRGDVLSASGSGFNANGEPHGISTCSGNALSGAVPPEGEASSGTTGQTTKDHDAVDD